MKVLGLCSHPIESAATRYRLIQYQAPLAERGIELTVKPFTSGEQFTTLYEPGNRIRKAAGMAVPFIRRLADTVQAGNFDLMFVQREAMLFGPAIFESLYKRVGKLPMVLDLDDATYLRYVSPTFGRALSFFKFFGKTNKLIEMSDAVVCGNSSIAEYVGKLGTEAIMIPTVVDAEIFSPKEKENEIPVIGWIGTHSTFPFLEALFPSLQQLAAKHEFVLKIVGAGREDIELLGVNIENVRWTLDTEIEQFRSIDIGLYPLIVSDQISSEWILGKSGFKAIQYMAVGIPFVMSPLGICSTMGIPGKTHFNADSMDGWFDKLDILLRDPQKRAEMGSAAREHSLANYSLPVQAERLAELFRRVANR